jgi:hypothetical protein
MTARSRHSSETTTEHSVLRVDKSAGNWEAIPTSLLNDARLGLDTRGFAAWLLARPAGWQIRASALPHLLISRSRHVGRDRARRFLRELERAGYLTRIRRRAADGRWIWDNAFRPTSSVSTIDAFSAGGLSVDGSTVDGKGVDITHTLINSRVDNFILDKTTTTAPPAKPLVVVVDLAEVRYPDCLTGRQLGAARKLIARCPPEHAQAVLDELGAMLRDGVVRHPMGLLNKFVECARAGQFVPNRSLANLSARAACNENLKTTGVHCSASSSSEPRLASKIAIQVLSKLHSKFDMESK